MAKLRTDEVVSSLANRMLAMPGDPDRLGPGERLSRGEIEGTYEIAPQTAQAVIAELVALGLAEKRAGGRAYVPDIPALYNLSDLAELFEMHVMSAIRYLVHAKTGLDLLPTVARAEPTLVSCVNVNIDFHAAVVRAGGSIWHQRSLGQLIGPAKLCLMQLGRMLGPQQLLDDHTAILSACIGAKDSGRAAGLLGVHWARIASLGDLKSPYLSGVEIIV